MADVFATGVLLWWLMGITILLTLGVAWPLMAFSATRNLKKIRLQLERLNDTLESQGGRSSVGTLKL